MAAPRDQQPSWSPAIAHSDYTQKSATNKPAFTKELNGVLARQSTASKTAATSPSSSETASTPGESTNGFSAVTSSSGIPTTNLNACGSQDSSRLDEGDITESVVLTNNNSARQRNRPKDVAEALTDLKALFRRKIQNIGDIFGEVKGDLLDITITTKDALRSKSNRLCKACSKIPFDQFDPAKYHNIKTDEKLRETEVVISLDRVLRNQNWCRFCHLLLRALSVQDNDPLRHPAVQDHIQPELKGMTFAQWARRANFIRRTITSQAIWPFGHSRDTLKPRPAIVSQPQSESTVPSGQNPTGIATQIISGIMGFGFGLGILAETDPTRLRILGILNGITQNIAFANSLQNKPLPVWIFVKTYKTPHPEAGTLVVDVYGYGRGLRAPSTCLSSFHLRVASNYNVEKESAELRYGHIFDPEKIDLSICRMWVEHCERQHGLICSPPSWSGRLEKPAEGVGFRVVDVSEERVVEFSNPAECDYVALSYVWGAYQTVTLVELNEHELHCVRGLSSANAGLPATIRSAMKVTAELGKRYLWVDSLCIVQDSDDKDKQISQMDRIYGNAAVTIVAADGINANSGLEGVSSSSQQREQQVAVEVRPGINVLIPVSYMPQLHPWESRAWTLQEKLLSRRLLIFSKGHVYFHCKHGVAREDMTAKDAGCGLPQIGWLSLPADEVASLTSTITVASDGSSRILRSPFFEQYCSLINQYTHRQMTSSSDVLNAIMGMMKILESSRYIHPLKKFKGSTLYGIPEEFLELAILWQPCSFERVRLRRRTLVDKDKKSLKDEDQLPSWSWAAWEAVASRGLITCGAMRYEQPFRVVTDHRGAHRKVLTGKGEAEERVKPILRWYRLSKSKSKKYPPPPARSPPSPPARSPPPPPPPARPSTSVAITPNQRRGKPSPASPQPNTFPPRIPPASSPKSPRFQNPKTLTPINGTGIGLALDPLEIPEDWSEFVNNALSPNIDEGLNLANLPAELLTYIDNRHLVFKTTTAQFCLGSRTLRSDMVWKSTGEDIVPDYDFQIYETEILDSQSCVVGRVVLDHRELPTQSRYDFIAISEAQYFGDEERVDVIGYPLYNVMLVDWDIEKPHFATRVALGKIYKRAWREAGPMEKIVILG